MSTFLHVALQHRFVSENQHIEDGLTGAIKGSVEIDVTASLFAAAVLAVDVAVYPWDQQVQAGPDGAARDAEWRSEQEQGQSGSPDGFFIVQNGYSRTIHLRHGDELGSG